MKILWLSPTPSHPQTAGNRAHIYQLGKRMLDMGHDIFFLHYNMEMVGEESLVAMRNFWPRFMNVYPSMVKPKIPSGNTYKIDDWYDNSLDPILKTLASENFDAFICEYVFMSRAFLAMPSNIIKILECHDRMGDRYLILRDSGIKPDFFYTTNEQESIGLQRADIVLAIQEEERRYFQSLCTAPVLEVGYMAPEVLLSPQDNVCTLNIGIMASANTLNIESIGRLIKEINSRQSLSRSIKIILAGKISEKFSGSNVINLGMIKDEKDFYSSIDAVINPMVSGTGLKIKTVSAALHGMPFISTTCGSCGLDTDHPAHLCPDIGGICDYLESICADKKSKLEELRIKSREISASITRKQANQIEKLISMISTKAKSVLLVTELPFWEEGVGNRSRISMLCRALKQKYKLKVFFFGSMYAQREEAIRTSGFANDIISYKLYEARSATSSATFVRETGSAWLDVRMHQSFFKSLNLYLTENPQFDAIIFEYIWNAYLKDAVPYNCLNILDTHDLLSVRKHLFHKLHNTPDFTLSQELDVFDRFDATLIIQKDEYARARNMLQKAIPILCSHATEAEYLPLPIGPAQFGFIGGNNTLNVEAIQWFIDEVWIFQKMSKARLHIFGSVCDHLYSLPNNIIAHGKVKDLGAAYARCSVMINPVINGSGIKIKSVESLAYGRPLITSPEGARGIDGGEESGMLICHTRSEFITAMLLLTADAAFRNSLSLKARQAALNKFTFESCYNSLMQLIASY